MANKQNKKTESAEQKYQLRELETVINELIAVLGDKMRFFLNVENVDRDLTGRERLRLYGAGARNLGFIETAYDIASKNPAFFPPYLSAAHLEASLQSLNDLRALSLVLHQFTKAVDDCALFASDTCYQNALSIYRALRAQTKSKVPGAAALFEIMRVFFSSRKPKNPKKPGEPLELTEEQLIKLLRKLLRGKADGMLKIANEQPRLTGGVHEVIDEITDNKGG